MTEAVYTAGEIASALGVTRQTLEHKLAGVNAGGTKIHGGVPSRAWRFQDLPPQVQSRLSTAATGAGCRDPRALLSQEPSVWKPAIPLVECSPESVGRAEKLRDALGTALERRNDCNVGAAELQDIGLRDYRRAFGHAISARRWHDLFHRTIERAGANPDFAKLELYLDERPASKGGPKPEPGRTDFLELGVALQQCRGISQPSAEVQKAILIKAIEAYDSLVDLGESPKTVKTRILEDLTRSGLNLARTREGLRKKFDRAYERWVMSGRSAAALEDGHKAEARRRRRTIPQEDEDVITALTIMECGGRLSQGWRRAVELQALSEGFLSRFVCNPSSKSYVPSIVRRAISPKITALLAQHHGERGARDNGAYVSRYWGLVPSGDWYCMDDATLPIYFYVPDGKGWFTLMRGQFLLTIDARSTCILGFALMPERNYNARVIRTLITKVADEYGLPRRGFYFEQGIWKSSKILKGETSDDVPLDWLEVEKGLTEFGLTFKHAIRARSKPVERILGALQNLMEGDPGYAGRNEMIDGFEPLARLKLQVESRKVDPRGKLYSPEQWESRLHELCQRYNSECQEGKMTGWNTPADAFERFKGNDKPVRLDARCRFLLAHHKRPVRIGVNGITLRFGKRIYNYKNSETGRLRGESAIAWFNPETPEILAVTDMKRENPFCVPLAPPVPAIDASKEQMAEAMATVEDHMRPAKTRYRVLKAKYDQEFRINVVAPEVVELGQQIDTQKALVRSAQELQGRGRRALRGINTLGQQRQMRPEEAQAAEELQRLIKRRQEEGI